MHITDAREQRRVKQEGMKGHQNVSISASWLKMEISRWQRSVPCRRAAPWSGNVLDLVTVNMYRVGNSQSRITCALAVLLSIISSTYSLHLKGVWNTEDEFFHFLAKFGFQKTTPHERELTEGFIFGNVTSLGSSVAPGGQGMLVLLPRQYFVDFYRNRTKATTDPDLACQLMFKVGLSTFVAHFFFVIFYLG